jgi:hypothetical protein
MARTRILQRRFWWVWVLVFLVSALIAARAALPHVVKDIVNERLQALESYDGRVADVDLSLWRGAYRVQGVHIVKTDADSRTPFFTGHQIDFGVEWRSLLRGSVVAACVLTRPQINLVQAETPRESQLGTEVNWQDQLEKLFPFRFNTVRAYDGRVTFRAPGIGTRDALQATGVNGEITNITNVGESAEDTFSGFSATATLLGSGSAKIDGRANPLARQPTFDVNLTLRNVQLPKVNPWLRKYINADAEKGDFELYTELAAADGQFAGYAKPIMRNVQLFSTEEDAKNPLHKLWEGIVELASEIVEDEDTDQIAARIPLRGTIEDPEAGIFETLVSVLRNAFVGAFARSLEGSISLRDVKKNLKELESKSDSGAPPTSD